MVFFLLLLLLEKNFSFTGAKTGRVLAAYHIGLNLTAVMFSVRGIVQVLMPALSSGMDAAISGVAGIGHPTGFAPVWDIAASVKKVKIFLEETPLCIVSISLFP